MLLNIQEKVNNNSDNIIYLHFKMLTCIYQEKHMQFTYF